MSWTQIFAAGMGFCISNSPSKMTKPEVLGILGLDVGDNWAYRCLLKVCRSCLDHIFASLTHFEMRTGPVTRFSLRKFP